MCVDGYPPRRCATIAKDARGSENGLTRPDPPSRAAPSSQAAVPHCSVQADLRAEVAGRRLRGPGYLMVVGPGPASVEDLLDELPRPGILPVHPPCRAPRPEVDPLHQQHARLDALAHG